jgi:outer membrane protein assembly factor BamB
MRKTMLLLSGLPAAGVGTATMTRIFSVLLAFCFICGASGSLAAAQASPQPAKPLWQAKLSVEETDFIEFTSKDRVLVGTVNTSDFGGGLQPNEIMLFNSVTGEKLWAVPRASYGSPQSLLAVDPAILIEGGKQIVALNPKNGAVLWSRGRAGETSLLLPDRNLLVFLDHKAAPMTISAVNVKTGNEAWKTPIENYPVDKNTRLDVSIMGDAVLLRGPEVAAYSAAGGKLLWRMPFPGTFGLISAAIPLGDDLYFSDGSTITRLDPASGKQVWRAVISKGTFQALTANESSVFILLKGSGVKPPDSIAALDRNTGKQLWNVSLLDRAASPISTDENLLYVTTPANLIALSALDGSVVFRATIPAELQSRRQLPDNLRIESDRIIVAREDGVLAVQKSDGKLLFADQVVGGKGFTYDYSTAMYRRASSVTGNRKHPVQLHSDSASPEDNYRVAMAQQQVAFNAIQAFNQRSMDQTNLILYGNSRPTYQQQQQAGRGIAVAGAAIGASMAVVSALNAVYLARIADTFQERVQHTYQTHANSLQDKFYIRPSYEQSSGWSLYVVNLETGGYASITLTSDADETPSLLAAHLPAFSTDGSRIVSKGVGPNPEWTEARRGLLKIRREVIYPSVLAFDLASLPFTQVSNIPATNSVDAQKSKLNEQLLEAASRNDLDAARQALDAGANINAVDAYGSTVLMLAAEASVGSGGKDPLIELLLEKGANADLRDADGLTAYEYATPVFVAPGAWNPRAIRDIHKAQKEHK